MEKGIETRMMNIMRKAIQSERVANKRYTLAESYALTDDEKKLFRTLADEELKHEEILMNRMREIKKELGLKALQKEEVKEEAPKKGKRQKKKEDKKVAAEAATETPPEPKPA
jgi:rubrerythrin